MAAENRTYSRMAGFGYSRHSSGKKLLLFGLASRINPNHIPGFI
jgi:hypothetical protein